MTSALGARCGSLATAQPLRLKREYQKQIKAHRRLIQQACHRQRIDFVEIFTDDPIETTLARYLTRRLKK